MPLLRRQGASNVSYDDQSSAMWNSFVGNWTRDTSQGYHNNTVTYTTTIGASLSFTFSGTQARLCGDISDITSVNGHLVSYPSIEYYVDDAYVGPQIPWSDTEGFIVYYQTPNLEYGTHQINLTVTAANETNLVIIDFIDVYTTPPAGGSSSVPSSVSTSAIETSRSTLSPAATPSGPPVTHATPIGAVIGGMIGGVVCVTVLVVVVWYFLKRRIHRQAYYSQDVRPGEILAGEGYANPFYGTAITPAPSPSFPPRQYQADPDYIAGITHGSGDMVQRRTGKVSPVVQNNQQSVQHDGSGIRLGENREQGVGPPQPPDEAPPPYTFQ